MERPKAEDGHAKLHPFSFAVKPWLPATSSLNFSEYFDIVNVAGSDEFGGMEVGM